MSDAVKLAKHDVRRALVQHHFTQSNTPDEAFYRLRSVQFDPTNPCGCNHDLVLQARIPGYRIGDWEKWAYQDKIIYDGWDKQASLVHMEGWPLRRIFHQVWGRRFKSIFEGHPEAVLSILAEIAERGPMSAKDSHLKESKAEWKGSWDGASLANRTLKALNHAGRVTTVGRHKNGQHIYDLTERFIPADLISRPLLAEEDAIRELVLERYKAAGLLRPTMPTDIWSFILNSAERNKATAQLVDDGELVPVEVEGFKGHVNEEFMALLDQPSLDPRVVFVAPMDPILWDRKMVSHVFGFDYVWEVFVPEPKRRWGYYVLPVLFGDSFVARVEFWSRDGVLEMRRWHTEAGFSSPRFMRALEDAIRRFMVYCSATEIRVCDGTESHIRDLVASI